MGMQRESVEHRDNRLSGSLSSALSALRRELERLYGGRLVKVLLYGSQARGNATPWSDVDVLVVLKGPVRPSEEITRTGEFVARICLEFDAVIQCLFMDEERFLEARSPLLHNISREAVEV